LRDDVESSSCYVTQMDSKTTERNQHLRLYLLCLFCLCGLTSCLYYGDIHGHSKPLSVSDLTKKHVYKTTAPTQHANERRRFNDPELRELIAIALKDSPDMEIAKARVRRADALVSGATSQLFPSIDFSGYVQRQKFAEFGLVPPPFNGRTFNIGELGFNFNYDFDFWGKHRQILAARLGEKCAALADLAHARLIISAAVANTYFHLLNEIAQKKIASENVSLVRQISTIVDYRASHGIESDIPVKTALANAESARLSVEKIKQAEMLYRNRLAILLGKNPFNTEIITHHFVYRPPQVSLPVPLTANLLAHRPDIQATKQRMQAAAHQINAAKARFFPDINLMGLFSYQSVGLGHLFDVGSQNNAITGAVDLPIFDAGARRANLSEKYAEYDLAVNHYNQTILKALHEVADQLTIIKSVSSQQRVQHLALKATAHHYKLIHSRYNHGIIDYVEVLESKQLLLKQQALSLNLETEHLQAVVGLLKALGENEMSQQG